MFRHVPVYKVTLHRDGGAELHVEGDCKLAKGDTVSVVGCRAFGRYCCAFDSIHFQALAPRYEADWTDDATCIVTASSGEKEKTVSDYGTVAPIGLWMVQQVLDVFVDSAEWSPKK